MQDDPQNPHRPAVTAPARPARVARRARLTWLLAGVATVAALGAGCAQGADEPAAADGGSATGGERDRAGSDGHDETGDGDGAVLGSAAGQHPADPLDATLLPLRVDVTALERRGDLVELRIVLTNEGEPDGPSFEPYSQFDDPRLQSGGAYSLSGAALVDGEGQKAYLTVIDSEGVCLCTGDMSSISIDGGDGAEMYATFGGVPDDVDTVDVTIPGFSPVVDVPIGG